MFLFLDMATITPVFTDWSDLAICQIASTSLFGTNTDTLNIVNL